MDPAALVVTFAGLALIVAVNLYFFAPRRRGPAPGRPADDAEPGGEPPAAADREDDRA